MRIVAAREAARQPGLQLRHRAAGLLRARAARAEGAAGLEAEEGWRHARDLAQRLAPAVAAGHAADQAVGVGMKGRVQHLSHIALFDDAAGIHHRDIVREASDHGQVMGDPDQGCAGGLRQLLHLRQDLALDGDVERGGGLIGHDQVGAVKQGDGDGDPLAHAARELVRVGFQPLVGARDANHAERVAGAAAGFVVADLLMRLHRLDHLGVDAQDRVQRHHRVLENHRDAVAAKLPHLLIRQLREVLALEQDLAGDDAAGRIDQPHHRKAGDRLARSGFPHKPEHLAAGHGEGDIVHRLHHASAGEEMGAEVADLERGGRGLRRDSWGVGHASSLPDSGRKAAGARRTTGPLTRQRVGAQAKLAEPAPGA
jgi:hypothetical protein